jgi:predicted AlkP superfamily pyrophosphatase or phosphodiesterase
MTRYIPASDILAILLIQSNYDPDTTLKQAILNVEKYEHIYNRYFMAWDGEFRFMFYWMAFQLELITFQDMNDSSGDFSDSIYDEMKFLENITIRDWIKNILNYEVYESNDSDQMWWERGKEGWFQVNGKNYILHEKTIIPDADGSYGHLEGETFRDFVRESMGSAQRIKESALFDCKLRSFFESPENINQESIADFFKENLKMDLLLTWSKGKFELPFNAHNISDIPNYIISALIPESPKNELTKLFPHYIHDKVIFFLIDGLGYNHLQEFTRTHDILKNIIEIGEYGLLSCQFPSTTTSNVTTFHTGQEVAQHGMYNWQYYEPVVDDIITPIPFSYAHDSESETLKNKFNPEDILPTENLYQKLAEYGIKSKVFQNEDYNDSTYSRTIINGADIMGYKSLDDGLEQLAKSIKEDKGKHYYLFYHDRIDKISHQYGPDSDEFKAEVNHILENLDKFRLRLSKHDENALFILSSDHGQIQDTGDNVYINLEFPEIEKYIKKSSQGKLLAPAGSPRAMFLHIKDDLLDEALEFLRDKLSKKAVVYKTFDLFENNDFNKENSPFRNYDESKISKELMARLGNLVILPVQNSFPSENWTVWWYEEGVFEINTLGHHGGLSFSEMRVPFFVWRYGDWIL